WLVRNHPEITDAQISKLIGTTKPTIKSIRERTHWKISMINPTDPVSLGLCTQIDLDALVSKAAANKAKLDAEANKGLEDGDSLKPLAKPAAPEPAAEEKKVEHTLESLFKPSGE
ncbi:MAG: cell cycle transcriptional regulator TrcR, partial [Litorimonas sp.]